MPIPSTPLAEQDFHSPAVNTVHDISYGIVSGTNRATVARIALLNGGGTTINSVVLDPAGAAIPLVRQVTINALAPGQPVAEIWTLPDASHPVAGTYTIRVTTSAARVIVANVQTWSAASQTGLGTAGGLTPPAGVKGTGAAPSITVPSTTGGLVLDCIAVYGTGSTTIAAGAGQTPDLNYGDTTGGGAMSHKVGAASVVMGWALTSQQNWALVAVALAPSNAAPVVTVTQPPAGAYPSGAKISCEATASDNEDGSLAASVEVSTDGGTTYGAPVICPTTITPADGSVRLRFTSAADTGGLTATPVLRDLTIGGAGGGTTLILEDEMQQQEVRQAGVATKVRVALFDTSGNRLTTNPLAAGDVKISINDGAPAITAGDAGLAAIAVVNGLIAIPIAAAELPTAGDNVTLFIQDQGATAYRAKSVEIVVFGGDPAVPETSADIADATKTKVEEAGGKLDTLTTIVTPARMGFVDNLNVGGLVAAQQEVLSIQNNTSAVRSVPQFMERPTAGTRSYIIEILLYNTTGGMATPDQAPALAVTNETGVSRADHLDVTAMTEVSGGRYRATYTLQPADVKEQLRFAFTVIENGVSREYTNSSNIVDVIAADFTTADRTLLQNLDTRLDDPRAALLDNLSRLDVASSTLTTPAQARAQADAALTAYGAAKPADLTGLSTFDPATDAVTAALASGEHTSIASAVASHFETTGGLSLDLIGILLKLAFQGKVSGASDKAGTTVIEHPDLPGYSLNVTDTDAFGNRLDTAILVTP